MKIKTITRENAERKNMEIWSGNEPGVYYARIQFGENRDNPDYGKVFLINNNKNVCTTTQN